MVQYHFYVDKEMPEIALYDKERCPSFLAAAEIRMHGCSYNMIDESLIVSTQAGLLQLLAALAQHATGFQIVDGRGKTVANQWR